MGASSVDETYTVTENTARNDHDRKKFETANRICKCARIQYTQHHPFTMLSHSKAQYCQKCCRHTICGRNGVVEWICSRILIGWGKKTVPDQEREESNTQGAGVGGTQPLASSRENLSLHQTFVCCKVEDRRSILDSSTSFSAASGSPTEQDCLTLRTSQ